MDSALSPRDIQSRIRAGESVEDVAAAAGVSVERIEGFAAPVLAERDHVVGLALTNPVRKSGETSSHRALRHAVDEQLSAARIDTDDVSWDSHLLGARRWQVLAEFQRDGETRVAHFVYDLTGRFTVPEDADARWMIGDVPPVPDSTDDPMALIHATTEDDELEEASEANDAYTSTELTEVDGLYDIVNGDDSDVDALLEMLQSFDEDSVRIYSGLVHPEGPVSDEPIEPLAIVPAAPAPSEADAMRDEPEDASSEETGDDAEETGDEAPSEPQRPTLVPVPDVAGPTFHDPVRERMAEAARSGQPRLSSVPMPGAGRPQPKPAAPRTPSKPLPAEQPVEPTQDALPEESVRIPVAAPTTSEPSSDEPEEEHTERLAAPEGAIELAEAAADPKLLEVAADPTTPARPVETTPDSPLKPTAPAEPEQPTLDGREVARPKTARRSRSSKRAQVPSWDEIMFGSPRKNPDLPDDK